MGSLPIPTENEVLQACLGWLQFNGVRCWRQNNVPVFDMKIMRYRKFNGMPGLADILGIMPPGSKRPGAFLAVECKVPGEVPTEDQLTFLKMITDNGGVRTWVSSVSELETDLKEFLDLNQMRMEF